MGASATATIPGTASTEEAVITRRGPNASMWRPTQTPTPPEMSWASEKAPVTATPDHPVSAVMEDCRVAKA